MIHEHSDAPIPNTLKLMLAQYGTATPTKLAERLHHYGETCGAPKTILRGRGGPYMTRYFIEDRDDAGRTYLHCIHRADEDEEYHDHPWQFTARIIVGGYVEQRLVRRFEPMLGEYLQSVSLHHVAGDSYTIGATEWHKVVGLIGYECWSVVVTGPKEKSWSFFNPRTGVVTPWREFIAAKWLDPHL